MPEHRGYQGPVKVKKRGRRAVGTKTRKYISEGERALGKVKCGKEEAEEGEVVV